MSVFILGFGRFLLDVFGFVVDLVFIFWFCRGRVVVGDIVGVLNKDI